MKAMLAVLVCMCLAGCSVVMATQQPDKKDLSFLTTGATKERVDAELGAPVTCRENTDGSSVAIYRFKQGYSKGAKASRAVLHGAADVLTWGLWEVVGTPIEAVATGHDATVTVTYDSDNRIRTAEIR